MTNQVPKHFSACEKTGLVFLSFFFPYATIAIVEGFGVHFWCNLVASIIVFLVVFLFGVPSFFAPILCKLFVINSFLILSSMDRCHCYCGTRTFD